MLTQYYPPEIGAPQIRLRSIASELGRHGITVDVLTAMPNYPAGRTFDEYRDRWYHREDIDGIAVRRTWVYAGTGRSARVRLANYFSFTLTALVAAFSGPAPAVLFVESQPLSLGFCAVLLKWLRGVPYIYNVPDLQIDVARQLGFLRSPRALQVATKLEDFFLRQAWNVSTVTHRFIEHFASRGVPRERISFLPNGADTRFLAPRPPCPELVRRWGLEGKLVFLYVGTHAYYHGLDTLIDAAAQLRNRSDIAFLMVGDGPERARLKAEVEKRGLSNVVFGQSPYDEMDRLYSIAYASIATLRNVDVAKQMRLSKIFPSLSCGVPVLYAGKGEAAELIATEKAGVVVAPEDPTALASAVEALASHPEERAAMGLAGRAFVEREYNWSAIVARWLDQIKAPVQQS
jgi:glycosyltransferase involved in cell wall biosynthesis